MIVAVRVCDIESDYAMDKRTANGAFVNGEIDSPSRTFK